MIAVRPLAQNLERPVYFGKGWKSERHSISVMRRLQSLSWVFELASQPRNLIGLDRIFEGLLPLSAGIGQAPRLAQHVAEVFVDGRIPSGINGGFFQVLARLLDVAQLEMSPAEAVEEAPLCRVDRD